LLKIVNRSWLCREKAFSRAAAYLAQPLQSGTPVVSKGLPANASGLSGKTVTGDIGPVEQGEEEAIKDPPALP
jgi:hypothetical protein